MISVQPIVVRAVASVVRWRTRAILLFVVALAMASFSPIARAGEPITVDLVVYGGTPAGVTAAAAAARQGRTVVVIEPQVRLGGMISGGLCKTDIGKRETIGGLSKEFFKRVHDYYVKAHGAESALAVGSRDGELPEPSVAQRVFEQMVAEAGTVQTLVGHRLVSADVTNGAIASIRIVPVVGGEETRVQGRAFVDASYEGDLMAAAGVPYRVGREARSEFDEQYAGVNAGPENILGTGDHRVQAYNIRGTITNRADIRIPFPKPQRYDPAPFISYKRSVLAGRAKTFADVLGVIEASKITGGKYDINVADLPGVNYAYPEGDWAQRREVYERTRDHWLSLLYMLQNDPELPDAFRADAAQWGLPSDEYTENGNVTPQIYVREARRMLGQYVMSEIDLRRNRFKKDGVAIGSYNLDSHIVQYLASPRGTIDEGHFIELVDPYEIPYRSIVPPNVKNLLVPCAMSATHVAYGSIRMEPVFMMLGQAAGLASHLALEMKDGPVVQKVFIDALRKQLVADGAVLDAPFRPLVNIDVEKKSIAPGESLTFKIDEQDVRVPLKRIWWNFDSSGEVQATKSVATYKFDKPGVREVTLLVEDGEGRKSQFERVQVQVGPEAVADVVVTAKNGEMIGGWVRSRAKDYDGRLLFTDGDSEKGMKKVRFVAKLPRAGKYMVALAYAAGPNRSKEVPVTIRHADGASTVKVDQRKASTPMVFKPLGEYRFDSAGDAVVEVSNEGTTGYVVADAVKWIWQGE